MELCIQLVYFEIAKGGRGRGARSLAGEGEIASDIAPGGEIAVTPVTLKMPTDFLRTVNANQLICMIYE